MDAQKEKLLETLRKAFEGSILEPVDNDASISDFMTVRVSLREDSLVDKESNVSFKDAYYERVIGALRGAGFSDVSFNNTGRIIIVKRIDAIPEAVEPKKKIADKAPRFTFKEHPPTGRFRSFDRMFIDIKQGGKVCGSINELSSDEWSITLMLKRRPDLIIAANPAPFKNIRLTYRAKSKNEAKSWINEHAEDIVSGFDLYLQRD